MDYQDMIMTALLVLGCGIAALLLENSKAGLLQYVSLLVQQAEQAIQGSGMGAAKKALVLAQLEAAGVRTSGWLSGQIDRIVAGLNARSAWLADRLGQAGEENHE